MHLTEPQLLALIESGEGKTLEFKQGLQHAPKLARTLTAFANTRGGILLIGVGDHGELLGAPHPPETLRALERLAHDYITPPLTPELSITLAESRRIVVCSVPLSPARPHTVLHDDGTHEIVVRVGSSNRVASGRALAELTAPRTSSRAATELELAALAWVEQRVAANVPATPIAFAEECHAGKQRARSTFMALERAGKLIGHGVGAARTYRPV
ncbi:MAG: ATP-binding protein [Planctomycetes bacterium]|nr:ATP-binding protein [Planctomycetota bacterium]